MCTKAIVGLLIADVLAAVLWTLALAAPRAPGAEEYRVKIVAVDAGQRRIEARFVIVPEDLRLVCEGAVRKIFVGDFVKVDFREGKVWVEGLECKQIAWVR